MSTAQIALSSRLNNHELDKLSEKMTELLKLSAVQALNSQINPDVYKFRPSMIKVGKKRPVSCPSVEMLVAEKFNKRDPSVRRVIRMDMGNDTAITRAIHDWGVDMRSSTPILEQIDVKHHFAFINGTTFSEAAVEKMVRGFSDFTAPSAIAPTREALKADLRAVNSRYGNIMKADLLRRIDDLVMVNIPELTHPDLEPPANNSIEFRIHEVKCVDETNPEWVGHDEIAWGGVTIDDKGVSAPIQEKYVRGGFDDGETKTYSPPAIIRTFPLDDANYPKTFTAVLALAEKDAGGFSSFIRQLWDAVKSQIQAIMMSLGAAAGAYIGAKIGGSIGTTIAGPLGTVIGVVAGAILGALIGWLISALKDDIFPTQETAAILTSDHDTFDGSPVSPAVFLDYRGSGGHYTVKCDWQLVR